MLGFHLLALALLATWVWQNNRPVALPDGPAPPARLQCVSYSPYHLSGQSPLDPAYVAPPAQIAADLERLAPLTRCVRIYSVAQGLDQVLPQARRLGLKVLLGAWISADRARNAQELDRAIALANAYPDTVQALIVGNEVLLRRELPEGELARLIRSAKARTRVPVTYADVWEFWRRHRGLEGSVDLVTVHILPFWEDQPVPHTQGVAHVARILALLGQEFHKPLLIGETGWPSAGRQRQGARAGPVEQARFIREFLVQAQNRGWHYNLIEAIDQPWKRQLEGTVGGYWGLLDAATLAPKFPWRGPVAAARDGRPLTLAALAGALILGLGGLLARWPGGATAQTTRALMGALAGALVLLQYEHGLQAYRSAWEWLILGAVALMGPALTLVLVRYPELAAGGPEASPSQVPSDASKASCQAPGESPGQGQGPEASPSHDPAPNPPGLRAAKSFSLLHGLILFAAAVAALLQAAAPRYRDFPTLLYLLPAFLLGACRWLAPWSQRRPLGRRVRLLALVLTLAGLLGWLEDPGNGEAQAWGLTCLVLATSTLGGRRPPLEPSPPTP
ncbi:beta-1,6-glucan synthase [Azospira inquinata]|uniref:Beta-1,6-glucan synthase n=1 Tax=Azospira inquinata TaxID=2785627 RepID=A0A975XW20_9RHOO|nr:beta-1,6-glucan synthase [Azospira inquinata]QWT50419.1 beta-1,6-glucan synthase [Azospira inquinata]